MIIKTESREEHKMKSICCDYIQPLRGWFFSGLPCIAYRVNSIKSLRDLNQNYVDQATHTGTDTVSLPKNAFPVFVKHHLAWRTMRI
jgi:hypothetical protein